MVGKKLKIAVVGAGPSGLCCTKNALEYDHDVTTFEQNSKVGGNWIYSAVYSDRIFDDIGQPIHSSLYKSLLTNIPIESMGFLDYPFPKKKRSFVHHEDVLAFFESYANHFNLNRAIKFQTQVVRIRPLKNDRWEVLSKNLTSNMYETREFDTIFICNGHYSVPSIPQFEGLELFTGKRMHSHDYRRPDSFENETVLVIGAGPSGKDISYEVATKAKRLFISHHRDLLGNALSSNMKEVGDIKCFTSDSVEFLNGDVEQITAIIFCTGYTYSFPFLSVDSELCMKDMYLVQPLYKHLINIKRPTMAIVGLQICAYTFMYDLQARLCLKYWSGELQLPTEEQMLEDFRVERERRKEKGRSIRQSHLLYRDQTKYLRELSEIGQMVKMPEVLLKIYEDCNDLRNEFPSSYREFNYTIIDDNTFERNRLTE